jgi:hypothetical protein
MSHVVIVCGGREYDDVQQMDRVLSHYLSNVPDLIIRHGGARGADLMAQDWADLHGIPTEVFYAKWKSEGRKAGVLRNLEMAKAGAVLVIAFPGGRGTQSMMEIAGRYGIPVKRVARLA